MKIKKIEIRNGISVKLGKEVLDSITIDLYHGDKELPDGTALHSMITAIDKLNNKSSRKALMEYYWDLSKVIEDIKNIQANVIEKLTGYEKLNKGKKK